MIELRKNLIYIFNSAKKHDKVLVFFIFINNIFMLFNIILPIILPRYIIDALIEGREYNTVLRYILLFAIGTISTSSLTYLLKTGIFVRSMTLRFKLIVESGKKFISMRYMHFENPEILDLSERGDYATANNVSGIEGVLHKFTNYGGNLLAFIVLGVSIFSISVWIAFLCLLLLAITYLISSRVAKYEKRIQDGLATTNRKWGYIIRMLSDTAYYKDIFVFNMQEMIFSKLSFLATEKSEKNKEIINRKNIKNNIFSILSAIQQIAIYIIFSTLVFNKVITIGEYTMYITAVYTFYSTAQQTINDSVFIMQQNEYIKDFRAFIDLDVSEEKTKYQTMPEVINKITFQNVCFRYHNQTADALNNISVSFNQNEKIAIVGLNGAGKTTLVKLITRLYEPISGAVYFNDINLVDVNRLELYDKYSVIFQESNLFAFTLAENISLKPLKHTNIERVIQCLEKVGLSDAVAKLPKGVMQPVLKIIDNDGVEFSGGELQKISLARALYKDAPIMILDEPTASYDALAEERIYKMFHDLTKNKTVFYISHRLASTRFCDRIIMLENGNIIEQGSHDDLIKQNGKYASLFQIQSQYYNERV